MDPDRKAPREQEPGLDTEYMGISRRDDSQRL